MIAGIVGIAVGILGKEFYVADLDGIQIKPEKKSSVWSGRLVFITAGILLLFIGIRMILVAD